MTGCPGFPTEKSTADTMPFLRCLAEESGHFSGPLGGRRFQDSEVEMAVREWKSQFVLRRSFWTRTNA